MKEGEEVVQDLLNCISEFDSFPFDPTAPTLQTLQSAIPTSDKLIADLKSYADGEATLLKILEELVFTKVKSLFDSVPKNKRLAFANDEKETSTSAKDKVTTGIMERVRLAAISRKSRKLVELAEKSGLVNLSGILQYRIWKNPYRFLIEIVPFKKYKKVSSSKNVILCLLIQVYM